MSEQMNKSPLANDLEYAKRNALAQLVCFQLDELFDKLEIELRHSGKMYLGPCPIHGGDNYSAINLYENEIDNAPAGYWKCNTHRCQKIFKPTIIGFVRGVLSAKHFNWSEEKPTENTAPFDKVITWLCKFIGRSWNDIKLDEKTVEQNKFINQVQLFKKVTTKESGLPRQSIRNTLQIPALYYINRGYKAETLDRFDVGVCTNASREMYERVVVPLYEETGKYMVGCTARSIFEKCAKCGAYHNPTQGCPDKNNRKRFTKWRHSGNTGSILYNWWNARQHIKSSSKVILVEGPGDVWRLTEAGINNAVGMFGADLTDEQEILLERSGAMNITVIRDNDPAGEICEATLKEKLQFYKLRFIVPKKKDVGEMTVEEIKQEILPCL
jgi:5S rRNA maturation endonuclease (ribonuclease M5)